MKTGVNVRQLASFGVATAIWAFSAIAIAQTPASRTPDTIVVIGCVTQQPSAGEKARGGGPTPANLEITDTRSNPPRTFILQGSRDHLTWHVGHTLEVHGRVTRGEPTGAAARDAQLPILHVEQVVYLQPACVAPPK